MSRLRKSRIIKNDFVERMRITIDTRLGMRDNGGGFALAPSKTINIADKVDAIQDYRNTIHFPRMDDRWRMK